AVAVSRARNRTGSWTLHFFGPDREVRNIDHEAPVRSLQFSPDDRWLVVDAGAGGLETGGAIRLWNPATAKAVGKSLQHPRLVHAIAFSPDLGHVATACDDGLVRLWRLADSQPGDVIIRLPRAVNSVAFAPDGRRLATACEDGGVRIWDTLTGEAISPPWRHELAALHVAFDNSGHRLASASLDETVRIWNAVPSSSSPTELLLRAEIASARRLSSAGTLRPLTQAEYRGVWRRKAGAQ
ncbi:MAG TPA: hypothetical protein PLV92_20795, partial [Pirellulaceae bacterium]|nr:hypothetical protein [Pirellulaceae bacterium]